MIWLIDSMISFYFVIFWKREALIMIKVLLKWKGKEVYPPPSWLVPVGSSGSSDPPQEPGPGPGLERPHRHFHQRPYLHSKINTSKASWYIWRFTAEGCRNVVAQVAPFDSVWFF